MCLRKRLKTLICPHGGQSRSDDEIVLHVKTSTSWCIFDRSPLEKNMKSDELVAAARMGDNYGVAYDKYEVSDKSTLVLARYRPRP